MKLNGEREKMLAKDIKKLLKKHDCYISGKEYPLSTQYGCKPGHFMIWSFMRYDGMEMSLEDVYDTN